MMGRRKSNTGLLMLALVCLAPLAAHGEEYPLPAPVPVAPAPGEVRENPRVTFLWKAVPGFDSRLYVYRLYIHATFTTGELDLAPINTATTSATVDLPGPANYRYRIQVFEAGPDGAAASPSSATVAFQVPFPRPTSTPTPTPIGVPPIDYNDDGYSNYRDLFALAAAWRSGADLTPAERAAFDLVTDGIIDDLDILRFLELRESTLDTPFPLLPENGRVFSIADSFNGRIVMTWEPVEGAVSYTVRLVGPFRFGTEVFNVAAPETEQRLFPITLIGTYTWRVVAFAADGSMSLRSPEAFFHLNIASTPTPTVTPTPTPTITPTPTPTEPFVIDLNADARINALDLFLFAAAWESRAGGEDGYDPAADLVPDGVINETDYHVFHRQWRFRDKYAPTPSP